MDNDSTTPREEQGYNQISGRMRYNLKDVAIGAPAELAGITARFLERRAAERSDASLGYSHITAQPDSYPKIDGGVVTVYANDVVVTRPGAAVRARGDRGTVQGMSQASHNRMVQQLNWLHWPEGGAWFCTVTWPDEFPQDDQMSCNQETGEILDAGLYGFQKAHAQFKELQRRVRRRWPGAEFFWRREWKVRRSGCRKGEVAPHYHFFLFGLPDGEDLAGVRQPVDEGSIGDFLRWTWTDITYNGSSDFLDQLEHGTDAVPITDRAHACRYISKYMAKFDDGVYFKTGRAWGYSRGLDFHPVAVLRFDQAQIYLIRWLLQALLAERGNSYAERFGALPDCAGFHVYVDANQVLGLLGKLKVHPVNRAGLQKGDRTWIAVT